jgi:hypothetical protein
VQQMFELLEGLVHGTLWIFGSLVDSATRHTAFCDEGYQKSHFRQCLKHRHITYAGVGSLNQTDCGRTIQHILLIYTTSADHVLF